MLLLLLVTKLVILSSFPPFTNVWIKLIDEYLYGFYKTIIPLDASGNHICMYKYTDHWFCFWKSSWWAASMWRAPPPFTDVRKKHIYCILKADYSNNCYTGWMLLVIILRTNTMLIDFVLESHRDEPHRKTKVRRSLRIFNSASTASPVQCKKWLRDRTCPPQTALSPVFLHSYAYDVEYLLRSTTHKHMYYNTNSR